MFLVRSFGNTVHILIPTPKWSVYFGVGVIIGTSFPELITNKVKINLLNVYEL